MSINHDRKDMELMRSVAIADGASTAVLDCLQTGCIDEASLVLSIPAQSSLADGKSVMVTVQGSGERDGSFAAVETIASVSMAGSATGADAREVRLRFPVDCPRFLRASVAVTSGASVSGSVEFSIQL